MWRFITLRLLIIPVALVAMNFAGFAYAHLARYVHERQSPYGSALETWPPVFALYREYLSSAWQGDLGSMPSGPSDTVVQGVASACVASLGLLGIAFVLSVVVGLAAGLGAVRVQPASVSGWVMPVASLGLAAPSFFLGVMLIAGMVFIALRGGEGARSPLPLQGFGWDAHLVMPVLALMLRPTVQIAQLTSRLLAGELEQQYVVAARSLGNSWRQVRWKHALGNILAPVVLTMARSLRLLVGELVLIEWLFVWPGLGRLLALTLIPPTVAGVGGFEHVGVYFLHPELMAALLTVLMLVLLLADSLTAVLVRLADPRLRGA